MERWQIVTAILAGYLGLTLFIGLRAGRRSSASVAGYVAGDRDFGLLVMYFVTGATVFSAFAFLGGPGWAYSRGAAAFYILAYGVLGIAPWYWIGPRAAAVGRREGYVTQAQLITGRFPSRTISVLFAVLSVAAFVPYVTLQMQGAGIVIEAVTDGHIPLWAGAALAYGIVVFYVLRGGVGAVGWTNTFQGIFMIVIAWTLGLYLPIRLYGGVGPMFEQIAAERPELLTVPGLAADGSPWSWGAYSSSILVSAIGISLWPHLFMKAFTARSDEILRRTVVLFPTFQLFLIPVFLIGFAGVLFQGGGPETPDFILPFMILETDLPAVVVGLFCAGALSASMSTGDALLHAAASVTVEDGIRPFRPMSDAAQRRVIQVLVVVVGVIAYWFALDEDSSLVVVRHTPHQPLAMWVCSTPTRSPTRPTPSRPTSASSDSVAALSLRVIAYWFALDEDSSLVVLLLTAYGIIAQFAPPVLATLYWRRATTQGVLAGLVAGALTSVFFLRNPELRPWDIHEGILGLVVHVPVLLAVSLATDPQDPTHVAGFVAEDEFAPRRPASDEARG